MSSSDLAGLREHEDVVDSEFAEVGNAPQFQTDAMAASIETYDATTLVLTQEELSDGQFVQTGTGYVAGTVEPVAYDARSEVDREATEYGDYRLYEYDDRSVALRDSAALYGWTRDSTPDGSGDRSVEHDTLLRSKIDALEDGAEPAEAVSRGLDGLGPFHSISATVSLNADERTLEGTSWEVQGVETTVRVATAADSAATFEERWSRESVVAYFEETFDDPDVSIEVGETRGTATVTVPTSATSLGAQE